MTFSEQEVYSNPKKFGAHDTSNFEVVGLQQENTSGSTFGRIEGYNCYDEFVPQIRVLG